VWRRLLLVVCAVRPFILFYFCFFFHLHRPPPLRCYCILCFRITTKRMLYITACMPITQTSSYIVAAFFRRHRCNWTGFVCNCVTLINVHTIFLLPSLYIWRIVSYLSFFQEKLNTLHIADAQWRYCVSIFPDYMNRVSPFSQGQWRI